MYRQQKNHFQSKDCRESIPNRIVSISKPYVRPIVRGKEVKSVEFGAKVNNIRNDLPAQYMWRNYQRLYESTRYGTYNPHPEYIDFETHIFTTEMSGLVNKQTSAARKMEGHREQLHWRKDNFFTDEFFKSFKVIVLACGNYLRNDGYNGDWEINRIFDVTYDVDGEHHFSNSDNFYCHHSSDGLRLVIHTRYLSSGVSGEMLLEMGKVIREHLEHCKIGYIFA